VAKFVTTRNVALLAVIGYAALCWSYWQRPPVPPAVGEVADPGPLFTINTTASWFLVVLLPQLIMPPIVLAVIAGVAAWFRSFLGAG
jgi:hypothetical protein